MSASVAVKNHKECVYSYCGQINFVAYLHTLRAVYKGLTPLIVVVVFVVATFDFPINVILDVFVSVVVTEFEIICLDLSYVHLGIKSSGDLS